MESAIKQIARRIDGRTERGRLTRRGDRERTSEFSGGRVRSHKGSGALLIRELIGMPRMPTTMEQGFGISSAERWGLQGPCKCRCNRGIGGAYISHGVVARDIEAYLAFVLPLRPVTISIAFVQLYSARKLCTGVTPPISGNFADYARDVRDVRGD